MGRIQHRPPVALGETVPVVWSARSSAMDDLRRTLFITSHIEAPVESIDRGLLISACPRHLPLHSIARAAAGGVTRDGRCGAAPARVGLQSHCH